MLVEFAEGATGTWVRLVIQRSHHEHETAVDYCPECIVLVANVATHERLVELCRVLAQGVASDLARSWEAASAERIGRATVGARGD